MAKNINNERDADEAREFALIAEIMLTNQRMASSASRRRTSVSRLPR